MHFVFDLDGTLTDSYPGIEGAFRHALNKINSHEEHRADFREFIGTPLPVSFSDLLKIPIEHTTHAVDHFREYYAASGWKENTVYSGIPELISTLHRSSVLLSVVTNKPVFYAEKILNHFQLRPYFTHVYGQELNYQPVSKAVLLGRLYGKLNSGPLYYVGDSKSDIEACRLCGIPVIAVGYGFGDKLSLKKMEPDFYADSVEELSLCLAKIRAC